MRRANLVPRALDVLRACSTKSNGSGTINRSSLVILPNKVGSGKVDREIDILRQCRNGGPRTLNGHLLMFPCDSIDCRSFETQFWVRYLKILNPPLTIIKFARREALIEGVTLGFDRRVAPGFPMDNYFVFRLCSASCCFPFKRNAFFPMSFNQRAFEKFVVCHCAIRTCAVKRDLTICVVSGWIL